MRKAQIRRPAPGDVEAVIAISAAGYPEAPEVADHWRQAADGSVMAAPAYVAADPVTGAVAGYACARLDLPNQPESGKYRIHAGVAPERRRQGIGGRLYATLMQDLTALGAVAVRARVPAGAADTIAFLERRGFAEIRRMLRLEVNIPAAPDRTARAVAPLRTAGVEFTTLAAELARDPGCLPAVHTLQNDCFADIPSPDPYVPPAYAQFARMMAEDRTLLFDGFFLARIGGAFAGLSYLSADAADPGLLFQRFTGVRGAFRGRGIATALKALCIEYARQRGARTIRTATLSINGPMLAVNRALGFREWSAEVRLERRD